MVLLYSKLVNGDCTPISELASDSTWIDWCNAGNCGIPPGSAPACKGVGPEVKCQCEQGTVFLYH